MHKQNGLCPAQRSFYFKIDPLRNCILHVIHLGLCTFVITNQKNFYFSFGFFNYQIFLCSGVYTC